MSPGMAGGWSCADIGHSHCHEGGDGDHRMRRFHDGRGDPCAAHPRKDAWEPIRSSGLSVMGLPFSA